MGLTLCRGVPAYARLLATFLEGDPNCILITEFHGDSEAELAAGIDRLEALLRRDRAGATAVVRAFEPARQRDRGEGRLAPHGRRGRLRRTGSQPGRRVPLR